MYKKVILAVLILLSLALAFLHAPDNFGRVFQALLVIWSVTLFALFTTFLREEVYKAWAIFSLLWVVVSFFLIINADNTAPVGNWALPQFSAAAWYTLISLSSYSVAGLLLVSGIYIYLWLRDRKKR